MSTEKYDLTEAVSLFFIESRDMLYEMESSLLKLEKGGADSETLNALFRSVHTIKGSSGMFGFEGIEKFTHKVEHLLDMIRTGKQQFTGDAGAVLLESHDLIADLLTHYESAGKQADTGLENRADVILSAITSILDIDRQAGDSSSPVGSETGCSDDHIIENSCWHISVRFRPHLFRNGLDPVPLIHYLEEFGNVQNLVTAANEMPAGDSFDPESCYLGFELYYCTDLQKEQIENIFEFVKEDCSLRIIPPGSRITEYVSLINDLPESPMHIGEMLIRTGSLTRAELEQILEYQKSMRSQDDSSGRENRFGEIIVEAYPQFKPVIDSALHKQQDIQRIEDNKKKSIRIDADKLDSLINLVGELVINGSNVQQLSSHLGDPDLIESVSAMSRLIENIRDSSMNIRMVQIGETFRRFERVVRDLSRDSGKKINLKISGAETELDKTLVEKLSDPLMHLLRNAVDHGAGTPEERTAAGKPEAVTISLNSYYETGSIVVEVSDDGSGLSREKIFAKAVEKGFINANRNISDNDLFQYIFEPGFSTASKVTSISGRGVGMDVVKKNIESMRGIIDIESSDRTGTTFRIHLPLTLAIIDGFMFQVGQSNYVVPLDMVTECIEVSHETIKADSGGSFINLRGDVLPFMRLRDFFRDSSNASKRENVIVLEYAKKKVGLIVDKLHGEFQTVIKPLGKIFDRLQWVSGSTILGSGDVALILDVPMLISHISRIESAKK